MSCTCSCTCLFSLLIRRPPRSTRTDTLFPYTTLFRSLIRKAFRGNFQVDYKADASPVTEVDIAAEHAIKSVLAAAFPTYGFYGEETGKDHADAENLWLVDPIDGTKAFVRGYPIFTVQIALMQRGELVFGQIGRAHV